MKQGSKGIDWLSVIVVTAFILLAIFVFVIEPPIQNQHISTIVNVTITDRDPPANDYQYAYVYLSDHKRYIVYNNTEFWKTRINSNCSVEMMYYPNSDQYRIGQVYNCNAV